MVRIAALWLVLLVEHASAFTPSPSNRLRTPSLRMSDAQGKKTVDARSPVRMDDGQTFTIAILGDLHLDPRYMDDHIAGREHFLPILTGKDGLPKKRSCVVSLGDLGESKPVKPDSKELFAGTSDCFKLAREYLDGFKVPFEVVGGNHDLEGIDEFPTDETNLAEYLKAFDKPTPQFRRDLADKVAIIGLGSTVFREAQYTSHEVYIDEEQIRWFKEQVESCPAEEGWKIFVFSHAPPMGSGLRVLQENHVVNGCCWLNHSGKNTRVFIDIVRKNPCIKAWFSGHFHLGQDYQDSITFPEGNNRGSCVFAQTAVMGKSRRAISASNLDWCAARRRASPFPPLTTSMAARSASTRPLPTPTVHTSRSCTPTPARTTTTRPSSLPTLPKRTTGATLRATTT